MPYYPANASFLVSTTADEFGRFLLEPEEFANAIQEAQANWDPSQTPLLYFAYVARQVVDLEIELEAIHLREQSLKGLYDRALSTRQEIFDKMCDLVEKDLCDFVVRKQSGFTKAQYNELKWSTPPPSFSLPSSPYPPCMPSINAATIGDNFFRRDFPKDTRRARPTCTACKRVGHLRLHCPNRQQELLNESAQGTADKSARMSTLPHMVISSSTAGSGVFSRTKKRAASKKGWKGWVEGSPPPSEKLINLDAVPVLQERRTRSGKF